MEVAVDGDEEVAGAAVEDDLQVAVVEAVGEGVYCVLVPVVFVIGDGAEVFFDPPVVGEGTEVYAAAGGACCAEEVFMTDGEVERAVSAHAEAGDGAVRAVGDGGIVGVDILDELFGDEGLIADGWVDGAVEVPAVEAAVGANEEDAEVVGFFL